MLRNFMSYIFFATLILPMDIDINPSNPLTGLTRQETSDAELSFVSDH